MMSKKMDILFNMAIRKANQFKHEFLTLEWLLLVLLEDSEVVKVLVDCGANVEELKKELESFLAQNEHFSILNQEQIDRLASEQFADPEIRRLAAQEGIFYQPDLTMALQRVLQRAAVHVQSSGKKQINGINLLASLFHEKDSHAVYFLERQGVERLQVIKSLAHGSDRPLTDSESGDKNGEDGEEIKDRGVSLSSYTEDLTKKAAQGLLDPLVGREPELQRIIQILCRRQKNNPLIVGESGVGKTALVEGLAQIIANKQVPPALANASIYSLDMASILAGAKYRGDFESRLKSLLQQLEQEQIKGAMPILFIDELHTVMGAGATGSGSMDASNLLKPFLGKGRIRCLGSTTHEEYRRFIEKDHAFSRRFQRVDIDEPNAQDTLAILKGLRARFEDYHQVTFSDEVLASSVALSTKYLTDRKLPDKAIDLIDEAGAAVQLKAVGQAERAVTIEILEEVTSLIAKVPRLSVASNELNQLKSLRDNLKMLIYGQDHAIEQVCDAIHLSRSGLGNDEKPMGCFLFAGPTGVGKTELARQLSINLGIHFERFDMSEYMEKHAVSKLIGAPPGYVGFDQGGKLTDAIKKNPHCVLLLDEIEKAHSDIFNILLQVMDHGALSDAQGRSTNFRNVILIMTTNAGAKEQDAGQIGLQHEVSLKATKVEKALKDFFSPEFRNRLDGIVYFSPLPKAVIKQIVEKFLSKLQHRLDEKEIFLEISDEVVTHIAEIGFDPKMGARPLERFIDRHIKHYLSREILFGNLSKGSKVAVSLAGGELQFRVL